MSAVQHVAMNCRDLRVQERFYTKHFGFRRARVFNAGTPGEFIMLRLDATCLELFQVGAEAKSARGGSQPVGFAHLAFDVSDIKKAVAKLNADGIQTEGIVDCSDSVPGLLICFFHDPDGNRVELMQGWNDQ
jgi:glyoxylase I family protein